jgi:hypothetical protein
MPESEPVTIAILFASRPAIALSPGIGSQPQGMRPVPVSR